MTTIHFDFTLLVHQKTAYCIRQCPDQTHPTSMYCKILICALCNMLCTAFIHPVAICCICFPLVAPKTISVQSVITGLLLMRGGLMVSMLDSGVSGKVQNMDPWSMDPLHGPGPRTRSIKIWTGSMDHFHGPGPWTPYFYYP